METTRCEEINHILESRLDSTVRLHKQIKSLVETDSSIIKNVLVSYYLDFSTGIEFLIRNILLSKYNKDVFVIDKLKITEKNHPTFYEYKDVEKLILSSFPKIRWIDFKKFILNNCYDVKKNDFPNHEDDYIVSTEDFKAAYTLAKDNRNKIAHDFHITRATFTMKTMILFGLAYYCLYKYYCEL